MDSFTIIIYHLKITHQEATRKQMLDEVYDEGIFKFYVNVTNRSLKQRIFTL